VIPELQLAVRAAHAAGDVLIAAADSGPRMVSQKGSRVDLVTEVDRAAEAAIRKVLVAATPNVPILGEEEGGDFDSLTRWVVDPLDGTTNFVHGFPFWCVSVALEVDGVGEVGVVFDPVRNKTYQAARGKGAFLGDRRLLVSGTKSMDEALVGTGFPYDRRDKAAFYLAHVQKMMVAARGVRRAGAAALDLALLAEGALDAFWEFRLAPWDVAAGVVLIREAGGMVTAHDGGPLQRRTPSPLATNAVLHNAMLVLLESVDASV
jgi:myo-inositol-1(or 4)-monophosphatase